MMKKERLERIEKYWRGQMDAVEVKVFQDDLKKDKELAKDLSNFKLATEAIDFQIEEQLRKDLKSLQKNQRQTRVVHIQPLKRALAIAAGFLLIFLLATVFYANLEYGDKAIASADLSSMELETQRGGDEKPNDLAGHDYFRMKKYVKAIELYNSVESSNERYNEARLFTANAYYHLESYDKALDIYNDLISKDDLSTRDSAQWNKVHTLFAMDNRGEEFNTTLQEILNNKEHTYIDAAEAFAEKINSPWRILVF